MADYVYLLRRQVEREFLSTCRQEHRLQERLREIIEFVYIKRQLWVWMKGN